MADINRLMNNQAIDDRARDVARDVAVNQSHARNKVEQQESTTVTKMAAQAAFLIGQGSRRGYSNGSPVAS